MDKDSLLEINNSLNGDTFIAQVKDVENKAKCVTLGMG